MKQQTRRCITVQHSILEKKKIIREAGHVESFDSITDSWDRSSRPKRDKNIYISIIIFELTNV